VKSKDTSPTESARFIAAAGKLATKFAWRARSFEREGEVVLVALTESDISFERFVWIYDIERGALRCLLASKEQVPSKRQLAILELCARVNEGLPFGCLEYSFSDHILVFRDSADLHWERLDEIINDTTARVLNLGHKYATAIHATLQGGKPKDVIADAEAAPGSATEGTHRGAREVGMLPKTR
jgi:hypothetical protein